MSKFKYGAVAACVALSLVAVVVNAPTPHVETPVKAVATYIPPEKEDVILPPATDKNIPFMFVMYMDSDHCKDVVPRRLTAATHYTTQTKAELKAGLEECWTRFQIATARKS